MPAPSSIHRLAAGLGLALAGGLATGQTAVPAEPLAVRALAATCASCHGTDGRAVSETTVPGLAGMPAQYLVGQMKAFKAGTRPATVMHQLARGYSDAQIEQMAAYFAARRR